MITTETSQQDGAEQKRKAQHQGEPREGDSAWRQKEEGMTTRGHGGAASSNDPRDSAFSKKWTERNGLGQAMACADGATSRASERGPEHRGSRGSRREQESTGR